MIIRLTGPDDSRQTIDNKKRKIFYSGKPVRGNADWHALILTADELSPIFTKHKWHNEIFTQDLSVWSVTKKEFSLNNILSTYLFLSRSLSFSQTSPAEPHSSVGSVADLRIEGR